MPTIESVTIEGFWGNHTVHLKFNSSVNFLIGRNGSGKTTAINIIASALDCDGEALERLPFRKVEIIFYDRINRKKPAITVERTSNSGQQYSSIIYQIRSSAKASKEDILEFSPFSYRLPYGELSRDIRRRAVPGYISPKSELFELKSEIAKLVKANWLSINRASNTRPQADRNINETLVDLKLREISERLVRYFSELTNKANAETRAFQRNAVSVAY